MGFLIRWKAQKRIKLGDQQIAQTQLLFNTRRGEIGLPYHIIIEEWLQHARELRHGLENLDHKPQQVHVEQSKLYCAWAGDTLHKVKGMLVPDEGQTSSAEEPA